MSTRNTPPGLALLGLFSGIIGCEPAPLVETLGTERVSSGLRAEATRIIELRRREDAVEAPREIIFQVSDPHSDLRSAGIYWTSDAPHRVYRQQVHLRLRWGDVDPLEKNPTQLLPEALRARWKDWRPRSEEGAYIVQFATLPFEDMQDELREMGVQLDVPLHHQAYVVRMSAALAAEVGALPYVRWVGNYHPGLKLEQGLVEAIASRSEQVEHLSVMVMRAGALQATVAEFVEELGGEVLLTTIGRRMEVRVTGDVAAEILTLPEVLFMDRPGVRESDLNLAREIGGATALETIQGYTGQGVRAEVMDGGLRTAHQEFQTNAPIIHTGNGSSLSHGTPVYGIVFGSGVNPSGRGFLPDAEQPIFSSYTRLGDRMAHTARLVDPSGIYRAVFQTNSWGNSRTLNYTTISADMDDILFTHDIAVSQSQSNAGDQMSRPQAWAKNIISVGGVRHFNTLSRNDDQWNRSASIGPASDGRIKPDLWHFYDSTFTASGSGNTSYTNFGGTSGATPITAGHLGLVFQMWADGVFDGAPGRNRNVFNTRPHMTTAKALLINSAHQYPFSGQSDDKTRVHQGWGMADVQNLYELAEDNGWSLPVLIDESRRILQGGRHNYDVTLRGAGALKATLVYADPAGNPASSVHRINDLTLRVTSPSGTVYWGNNGLLDGPWSTSGGSANTVDTVENVFVQNPGNGQWRIQVQANAIVQDGRVETSGLDADYALVVSFVNAPNAPPVLARIGARTVNEGQTLTFTAAATDADGDPITYAASGLPANATFNASTGVFRFTPSFSQAGNYAVTITASDGNGGTDSEVVNITVVDVSSSSLLVGRLTWAQANSTTWYTRSLSSAPSNPVVIAGPPSLNGGHPSTIRLRNVGNASFQYQLDEWDYLDGGHTSENVDYIAAQRGAFTLGSLRAEGGSVAIDHNWTTVSFAQSFTAVPVVLPQVVTFAGPSAVTVRIRNVTQNAFQLRLQEEENNDGTHAVETVHFLAVQSGSTTVGGRPVRVGRTGNSVTHAFSTISFSNVPAPRFFGSMQTFDGSDAAALRYRNLGSTSVQVKVEEETSRDTEVNHTTEVVGYMVVGGN